MEQLRNEDLQGETEELGEKRASVPLRPSGISHRTVWTNFSVHH
jgi:hypothetical protein